MLIVDVECSGGDARRASIVSIGAINFLNPENKFHIECQIIEGAEIQEEALGVNGFTREQIQDKNKPTCKEALEKFFEWALKNDCITLAGHMTQFDQAFLNYNAERVGLKSPFGKRLIDLHSIAYTHMMQRGLNPPLKDKQSNFSSDFVMDYVGLPREPRPHIAINGATWEAEAFSRILFGKYLFEEFSQHPIPEYLKR